MGPCGKLFHRVPAKRSFCHLRQMAAGSAIVVVAVEQAAGIVAAVELPAAGDSAAVDSTLDDPVDFRWHPTL